MKKIINSLKIMRKNNGLEDLLKTLHPKQVVDLREERITYGFLVKYRYTTLRGNVKNGNKLFLIESFPKEEEIKEKFNKWVESYNDSNPHRCISNVKFLEYSCAGKMVGRK